MNSSAYDLLPFMVGHIHNSFTLLSVKEYDAILSNSSRSSKLCAHGTQYIQTGGTLEQTWVSSDMLICPWMGDKIKSADIIDCYHSQQSRSLMTLTGQKGR
jgi:hypothetical protein